MIFIGRYSLSRELRVRLDYFRLHYGIKEEDYNQFDAMRQTAQCIGRTVRNKQDYSICVLADSRYAKDKYISKLPEWIKSKLVDENRYLSAEMSTVIISKCLKKMAQRNDDSEYN